MKKFACLEISKNWALGITQTQVRVYFRKFNFMSKVSMQCVTRVGQESTWEVDLVLQVQKSIEYKYIFMEKQCITRWETITGNRTVTPGVVNFAL